MMIRIYYPCLFLCVILVSNCNGDKVLEDVLTAVEKAVAFYSESYTDMNIDAVFGLRVMEGQLKLMLDFLQNKSRLYERLDEVYQRAKSIGESAVNVLKESDQNYFKLLSPVIQQPWAFHRKYRRIDPMLKWKNISRPDIGLSESSSDRCMSELMGVQTKARCSFSRECVTVMSTPGMDGYAILHQLLYTMLAEERNCLNILNGAMGRLPNQTLTVEKLQAEFCANNFFETSRSVIVLKQVNGSVLHDLFLEQELVCTMLGFVEFLHIDWLRLILSWQMPSGCFGESELDKERHAKGEQRGSRTGGDDGVDFELQTRVVQLPQPNENLPLSSKPRGIFGKDGLLNGVAPLARVIPRPAGRNPREEFVGLNSNARKRGYNDSKIRNGMLVMGMNPLDKERGQLGKRRIKFNHHNGFVDPAARELHHEQGRVGDTRIRRMAKRVDDQGDLGSFRKGLIPMAETGGGVNQPRADSDEESFRINRQINRKLQYEKSLKDGCLAHKTGVAMGALSQYLRFLIFANSSGFNANEHLNGINYLMHPESLLPSSAPPTSGLMKTTLPPIERKLVESSFMKSSTKAKLYFQKGASTGAKRSNVDGRRDRQFKRLGHRGTPDLSLLVVTNELPIDTKDSDHDTARNVDKVKKSQTVERELYEEDDAHDVAMGTERPVVKSHEDDLLLYDELANKKPKVSITVGLGTTNRLVAKDSHAHSSGDTGVEGVSSVSSTYAFVVVITAVILLFLYRSLRKHRTGSQHRHGGRWK